MKSRNYVITTLFLLLGIIPAFSQNSPEINDVKTTTQDVNDDVTLNPFTGISISDLENSNVDVEITYDNTYGEIDGGANGVYTLSNATPASATSTVAALVFTPNENTISSGGSEVVEFEIKVTDKDLGGSNSTTNNDVKVEITSVNDAPTFTAPGNVTVNENSGLAYVSVTAISDVDADETLTLSVAEQSPNGLLESLSVSYTSKNTDGIIFFTPAKGTFGSTTIDVTLSDGDENVTKTFTINVTEVNFPPVFKNNNPQTIVYENGKGQAPDTYSFTPNVEDVDGDNLIFSINEGVVPDWLDFDTKTGELTNKTGRPNAGDLGVTSITMKVTDGDKDDELSFSINVLAAENSLPSFNLDKTFIEIPEGPNTQTVKITDLSVGPNDAGQEFVSLTVSNGSPALLENVSIPSTFFTDPNNQPKDGYELKFTPISGRAGTATLTVKLTDNGSDNNTFERNITVKINASTANIAPTIDEVTPINRDEDGGSPNISLKGIGPGEATGQFVESVIAENLSENLLKDVSVEYTQGESTAILKYNLVENAHGTGKIRVTVKDNGGTSGGGDDTNFIEIIINVAPVNDAPKILGQNGVIEINEDNSIQILLSNLITEDVDGDQLTLEVENGDNYIFPDKANFPNTIKPNPLGFNGTLKVNVLVSDGVLKDDDFQLTVNVLPINSLPIIEGFKDGFDATVFEDKVKTIKISDLKISDPDNSDFTFNTISDEPTDNYEIVSQSATEFKVKPTLNSTTNLSIPVTVKDDANPAGESNKINLVIKVNPVNDAPIITGQFFDDLNDVLEDNGMEISLGLLKVSDVDNVWPDDFTLEVLGGNNYSIDPENKKRIIPAANFNGLLTVPVKVNDKNKDSNIFNLKIDVLPVNDAPTINKPNDVTIDNDNGSPFSVALSNISRGPDNERNQNITASTIVVISSNEALIKKDDITVNYSKNANVATLNIDPEDNVSGTTTITVRVTDDGGLENGGVDTKEVTFDVTVIGKNKKPEIDNIKTIVTFENDKQESIRLKGINDGDDGTQDITVSVSTDRPDLVTNFKVFYTSPDKTGDITYDLVPDANGIAEVTVTVKDDGPADDTGNENETKEVFEIQIFKRNGEPTIDQAADTTLLEDTGEITIPLMGISDGDSEENQKMWIVPESNRPDKIPAPTVVYDSVSSEAVLTFTPEPNVSGEVILSVTVFDDGNDQIGSDNQTTMAFKVNILPVNDIPTISPVEGILMQEGKGQQIIPISGITDGDPDLVQTISSVRVTSNKPEFYDELRIAYREGDINGDLIFTPHPDANGFDTLTITVMDNGGVENGGIDSKSITVPIEVIPLNDAPTITAVPDKPDIGKNAGEQIVFLTGITDGDPELNQNIEISAISSNTDVIPNPGKVEYVQGSGEAVLKFKPLKDTRSTKPIVITIILKDDGGLPGVDVKEITFKVGVGVVNNAPIITDADGNPLQEEELEYATTKDNPITLCLYATDLDKDVVSFSLTEAEFEGDYGVLDTSTLIANGDSLCIDYVPYATTLSGTDEFNVTICDNVQPDQACDTITIRMNVAPSSEIVVYDGISPKNQDNKNDKWFIEGIENFPDNNVQIYSATGMLVFDMAGYNNDDKVWGGDSNVGVHLGKTELPTGVYYYVIDFGSNELEPKKGSVVIK